MNSQQGKPVDSVLQALASPLATELERVLQAVREETLQAADREFTSRLETALRVTEEKAALLAATDREQAVAAAREEVRQQITAEMDQRLQETSNQLKAESTAQAQAAEAQWTAEKSGLLGDAERLQREKEQLEGALIEAQAQGNLWRTFAEAQPQLAESTTQSEMLLRFLALAESFAGGLAVYVTKPGGLALWKTRGQGAFPEVISQETIDPEFYFKPLVVRGRTVVAVCARQTGNIEALDFLSSSLGRAIETLGVKLQTPMPRLGQTTGADTSAGSSPIAETAASSAAAGSTAAKSAPAPAAESKLTAEARLAARLLVSEIKLYNEQDVLDGRAASDIYARLKKPIDEGRQQFRQRVNGITTRDFYHEELIRVLADGDASLLGRDYPGPASS